MTRIVITTTALPETVTDGPISGVRWALRARAGHPGARRVGRTEDPLIRCFEIAPLALGKGANPLVGGLSLADGVKED